MTDKPVELGLTGSDGSERSGERQLLARLGRADRDREGLTVGLQRTRLPWARTDASDEILTFD